MGVFSIERYLEDLKYLVNIDSGSRNPDGLNKIADFFEEKYKALGWSVERYVPEQRPVPCLIITNTNKVYSAGGFSEEEFSAKSSDSGDTTGKKYDILFLGHMDTVFEKGEALNRPFTIQGNKAFGPGIIDMKAGLLSLYYTMASIQDVKGLSVSILLNGDEEIGSGSSRLFIEKLARESKCAFVMEPARENGSLVLERKGIGSFYIEFYGRAAHAGIEPEKGINALEEMGHWIVELQKLSKPELGTTLNVCVASGGTVSNVIPDYAALKADLRFLDNSEVDRIKDRIEAMRKNPWVKGIRVEYDGKVNRPPMKCGEKTRVLQKIVEESAEAAGVIFGWAVTGGGSDGNYAAAVGIPVIDGMGPVGGGAHGKQEYLLIDSVEPRLNLLKDAIVRLKQYSRD